MLEFVAKNMLARRARGRFLVLTNPDDIFSEAVVFPFLTQDNNGSQLVEELSLNYLRSDTIYLAPRGGTVGVPNSGETSATSLLNYLHTNSKWEVVYWVGGSPK